MRKNYGEYIRAARKRAGIKQTDLADAIGVDKAYLCRIEKGNQAAPPPEKIEIIAKELGEDADILTLRCGRIPEWIEILLREEPEASVAALSNIGKLS